VFTIERMAAFYVDAFGLRREDRPRAGATTPRIEG